MNNILSPNVQRSLKSQIERTKCPVHGDHPKAAFTSKGFSVSCCCETFRKKTIAKCEAALKNAIAEQIKKSLRH